MSKITVIGAGSWGKALAKMWTMNGKSVRIWDRGMDMAKCCDGSGIIVNAVPSHATRAVAKMIAGVYKEGQIIVNASKGLEDGSFMTLSEVIREEVGDGANVAVMSGPSHAEEVSLNLPTTNIIACDKRDIAEDMQAKLSTSTFRLYAASDRRGVEICGSFKNIIALCAGISDGIGYGDNTRAALITRGIVEMMRLGVKLGGEQKTFLGLAGIGDTIVTATSKHSRNYRAGFLIGKGRSVEEAVSEVKMVVEGIIATKVARSLAEREGVECPIITEAYEIIYNGKVPRVAVDDLMNRELKWE